MQHEDNSVDSPYVLVCICRVSIVLHQIRLKKAARLIQMSAAFAKPPEQKVKQEIKALQSSAHKQALKKLLYGWATVQLAFRVMASEDYTWPVLIVCLSSGSLYFRTSRDNSEEYAEDGLSACCLK